MRAVKILIVLGVAGIFLLAVAAGFLVIISGGQPVDFIQTAFLRIVISSRQEDLETAYSSDDTLRRFEVVSGDTPAQVGNRLVTEQIIRDAELFVNYMRVENLDTQLRDGTFFLRQTQTIPDIARTLTDVSQTAIIFSIPEGSRIEEVIERVADNTRFQFSPEEFAAYVEAGAVIPEGFATQMGIPAGSSLEGFLFPDVYELPPDISAAGLRDTLLENFRNSVGTQLITDAMADSLTMRDIVIIASIAEREAVHNDEHPLITSVYRNRLDIGMKLDADPTVQYALNGARGRWWPRITTADYRGVDSIYNTYLNTGLPPGPIASPGLSAIRAAVYPAETSYIYFRARCDGSNYHNFATTYDEHLANGC